MSFEWLDLTLCEPNHSWVYFDIPDERYPGSRWPRQQASYSVDFIKCDECGLFLDVSHTGQRLWFTILEPQTGQKLDAARMRIANVKL